MNKLESISLGILALSILILGVWPKPLIDLMNESINLLTLFITGT
jgi:NADH:ubiquinone oxidoreductase subunit 4 (subunit M)